MKCLIASNESNFQLRSLLENPASSVEEICRVLSGNPSFSAYILRVVNNPFFGVDGSVDDLSRAIALLGKGQITEMLQSEELLLTNMTSVKKPNLPVWGFRVQEWRFV